MSAKAKVKLVVAARPHHVAPIGVNVQPADRMTLLSRKVLGTSMSLYKASIDLPFHVTVAYSVANGNMTIITFGASSGARRQAISDFVEKEPEYLEA